MKDRKVTLPNIIILYATCPHEHNGLSTRFFLNKCWFNALHSSRKRVWRIWLLCETCMVSKYGGIFWVAILRLRLKLSIVGDCLTVSSSEFQFLSVAGRNEL